MKCKIDITSATDVAAWVTRKAFYENVDEWDLGLREAKTILDRYHSDWFRDSTDGLRFTPPAFVFRDGFLMGINGRHRAILLFRHMKAIPMLLAIPEIWPKEKFAEIALKRIEEDGVVELPDLPIQLF
ncbi:MAG: hypothetical protein ACOC03_01270 [Desulfosalsimonas sp.]